MKNLFIFCLVSSLCSLTFANAAEEMKEVSKKDRAVLLNKLSAFKGDVAGGSMAQLKASIKAAKKSKTTYFGCEAAKELEEGSPDSPVVCQLNVIVGTRLSQIGFGLDNSNYSQAVVNRVDFLDCSQGQIEYEDRHTGGVGQYCGSTEETPSGREEPVQ
jgi:hypothetical protein